MKTYSKLILAAIAAVCIAAVVKQSDSIYILDAANPADSKIKLRGLNQTGPWVEIVDGDTLVFAVASNGKVSKSYVGGLLHGSVTTATDTTVTNTFSVAFSSAPNVVLTSTTNALPHIISITASNFVAAAAASDAVIQWIAIGSP